MNHNLIYGILFGLLLVLELIYFRIADKFNIIDKPNERSSHSAIVLRGGGIIFLIGAWIWSAFFGLPYPWFLAGLTMVAESVLSMILLLDSVDKQLDDCILSRAHSR